MQNQILTDVLSGTINKPLYHYTNQRGFLGIIRSKEMWLTHTQYLNDRREFLHAVDLVKEEVENRLSTASIETGDFLSAMQNTLKLNLATINVCVCSFSEASDSLSQWRAYAMPAGYSIGFPGNFLREIAQAENFYFAPCIYNPTKQREIIRALVDEVLYELLNNSPGIHIPEGGSLVAYLYRYAPLLKSESFKEEQEWRIISRPLFNTLDGFDFREGRSLLIPYYKLRLRNASNEFYVSDIVIGPTQDEERSLRSTTNFLMHEKIFDRYPTRPMPVKSSQVPYRDW